VDIFPYIFLAYMALGGAWLFMANRRNPGILTDIAVDLAQAPGHGAPGGAEVGTIDLVELERSQGAPAIDRGLAAEPA
jgi:hypothetical protein